MAGHVASPDGADADEDGPDGRDADDGVEMRDGGDDGVRRAREEPLGDDPERGREHQPEREDRQHTADRRGVTPDVHRPTVGRGRSMTFRLETARAPAALTGRFG